MKDITPRERTIVERVLEFDYYEGHDFSRLYPTETDVLFLGVKHTAWGPYTCLGIIAEEKVGYMGIKVNSASFAPVEKRHLISIKDILECDDPIDLAGRVGMGLPGLHRHGEIKKHLAEYREHLGMFHRNYDGWQEFVNELRTGKDKRNTKRFAQLLKEGLAILDEQIKSGAEALLNPDSPHPVHDFLMVVDEAYRAEEVIFNEVGSSLANL